MLGLNINHSVQMFQLHLQSIFRRPSTQIGRQTLNQEMWLQLLAGLTIPRDRAYRQLVPRIRDSLTKSGGLPDCVPPNHPGHTKRVGINSARPYRCLIGPTSPQVDTNNRKEIGWEAWTRLPRVPRSGIEGNQDKQIQRLQGQL